MQNNCSHLKVGYIAQIGGGNDALEASAKKAAFSHFHINEKVIQHERLKKVAILFTKHQQATLFGILHRGIETN